MIKEFQGEFRFLSNFTDVEIEFEGRTFPSVEHAYMSAKSDDEHWKDFCSQKEIPAGTVKRKSKNITLVNNWEVKKVDIMKILIRQKFNKQPFKNLLLSTGDQIIQEGNNWNDKFWGVCLKTNQGENYLGKIIMKIREELQS